MNAPLKQARSVEESSRGGTLETVAARRAQSPRETVLAIIGRDPEASDNGELGENSEGLEALFQQGALGASSDGNNPHISNGDYLPSGVMLAMITRALREAGDNQLEIQQQQAAAEQQYYRVLGGLNAGGISKGIIAMAAQSVINAGDAEAQGLWTQGISNAINAAISGTTTVGAGALGAYNARQESNVGTEIDEAKAAGKQLEGSKLADLSVASEKNQVDEALGQQIDQGGLDDKEKPVHDAVEAVKMSPKQLESAKAANSKKLEDLEKQQKKYNESTSKWVNFNQSFTQVVGAATSAVGNIAQSEAKASAAAYNASAQVQKQTQDMNYSAANTFKENAKTAAQQALQTADIMAQVAQSQVQVRG